MYDHRGGKTMRLSGGSSNGLSSSAPFDRWYRYPAGFSRSSLKLALDVAHESRSVDLVVDPFAGTGSVGTALFETGSGFAGLEAHPEIAELANLKFERRGPSGGLIEAAADVVRRTQPAPIASEHELVRRCFDDEVLAKLVGLRTVIVGSSEQAWSKYLKWALLGTLRDVASVKVGWPYQRPALPRVAPHSDPVKRFAQRVQWIAEDLAEAPPAFRSSVISADSRDPGVWRGFLNPSSADASVSSPPYLNNFDYADATRIELYFWRTASSWREMCQVVRSGMIIATTQQTRIELAREAARRMEMYPTFRCELRPLIRALAIERAQRRQGKEYDRVLGPYFLGIVNVLSNLFEVLKHGGRCVWLVGDSAPYGIYVDTPRYIAHLARDVGFVLQDDILVRSRGRRWEGNGVRHTMELSERLIVFARPDS
jgi:hypothetical protein